MTDDETTMNSIPQNVEYAGFWIRVGAAILDMMIFIPLSLLEFYNKLSLHSIPILLLGSALMIIYKPYLEYTRGATIGKQLVGVKVVNEELQALTLNQAILRYIPWLIFSGISIMMSLEYYWSGEYVDSFMEMGVVVQDSFWYSLNRLYNFVFIGIVIVVAFDKQKQGLHDKIAETYCIKVN